LFIHFVLVGAAYERQSVPCRLEEAAEVRSVSRREACGEMKLRIAVIACALVSPARASEVGSSAARPVNLT
jgi:hypothetical protein